VLLQQLNFEDYILLDHQNYDGAKYKILAACQSLVAEAGVLLIGGVGSGWRWLIQLRASDHSSENNGFNLYIYFISFLQLQGPLAHAEVSWALLLGRGICTTSATHKNIRAGQIKGSISRNIPVTYEQAQYPHQIGVTKSWNSWNTCEKS
jgi:hypothetical protein